MWINGEPFDFQNWADGEPNHSPEGSYDFCVEMHTSDGTWNDDSCELNKGYICKAERSMQFIIFEFED